MSWRSPLTAFRGETDTLIAATHFPSPSLGHFVRAGDAFGYRYRNDG